MKILLDLNIWIDVAARKTIFPDSRLLLRELEKQQHEICFPLSSYTTLYYLLKQLINDEAALAFCILLRQRKFRMLPFTKEEVQLAQTMGFSDHEDACVAASALHNGCEYIVSRDTKGFSSSPVPSISPAELLKKLK